MSCTFSASRGENSLRKQTDFPPVALRRQKVLFGGAKKQAENPSVFAGYGEKNLRKLRIIIVSVLPLGSSDVLMLSDISILATTWSWGHHYHQSGFARPLSFQEKLSTSSSHAFDNWRRSANFIIPNVKSKLK